MDIISQNLINSNEINGNVQCNIFDRYTLRDSFKNVNVNSIKH